MARDSNDHLRTGIEVQYKEFDFNGGDWNAMVSWSIDDYEWDDDHLEDDITGPRRTGRVGELRVSCGSFEVLGDIGRLPMLEQIMILEKLERDYLERCEQENIEIDERYANQRG
jgi:hypothetical protein